MTQSQPKPLMEVPPYQDRLGAFAERHPQWFLKLGNIETSYFSDALAKLRIERPIFITGLARSGSTILLELLSGHADLATHRYRDFPMLQVPLWWNWFLDRAAGGKQTAIERYHRDGIFITPDSPEAMEEVLWMSFFRDAHNPKVSGLLGRNDSHPAFENFFRDHLRKLLMLRKGKRYLGKGNYNVSRLGYLHKLFPDARFVIPVREPSTHIASLMKQHKLFCTEEQRDPRVLAYMCRAGHYEFGLNRVPIHFGDTEAVARIEECWSQGEEVRGWARYWSMVYDHVVRQINEDRALAAQVLPVDYDTLCQNPKAGLQNLHRHCGLEFSTEALDQQAARIHAPGYYKPDFTDADLAIIREETSQTMQRISALCAG